MCTLPLEKLANFTLNYQKFAAAQMQMSNMTGQMIKIAIIRCNLRVLHKIIPSVLFLRGKCV